MAPRVEPVTADSELPARVDVVVIGGGIVGASTAFFLAQKGFSVALCEKGQIASEQSSRNWGFCRQQGRDPRELPLIIESMHIWRTIDRTVEGDTGFRQAGVVYVAEDEKEAVAQERWLEYARPYRLDTRVVSGQELAALLPGAARTWPRALHTASDGHAEPQRAAPAIAAAIRRLGGKVLTTCAARGLDTAAGRVGGVVTERGRIGCSSAVLAGGSWSRLFCRNLGITLPQLNVRASVMRTSLPSLLARLKSKDESFTKVILRLAQKRNKGSLLDYIRSIAPDNELADRLEEALEERQKIRLGVRGR